MRASPVVRHGRPYHPEQLFCCVCPPGFANAPTVHAALCVRPDPTDPALDRAMSVRLVSISGRAFAEQSGFAVGGRGGRSPTSLALWARWVTMVTSTPLVQAGKWTSGGNRSAGPGLPWANWVTGRAAGHAHHEIPAAAPVDGVLQQAKRRPVAGFPRSPGMWELATARPGRRSRARAPASG